jgi:hypothetical protein
MKPLFKVEYSKVGSDGFLAQIYTPFNEESRDAFTVFDWELVEEFFSEDYKVLIDRVLFFLADRTEWKE